MTRLSQMNMYRFGRGRTLPFEDTIPVLIPVAAESNTWLYGRSLVGTAGSNPVEGTSVYLL
jgi:hypothetical protein